MVMELLMADQPARETAHDPASKFWKLGRRDERRDQPLSRSARKSAPTAAIRRWRSTSTPASSAISASAPAAKCRSTTSSAWRGAGTTRRSCSTSTIRWAHSTCVACGECVQACPTGALMPATLVNSDNVRTEAHFPDRKVDSVCPYCGVGCQLTYNIKDDKLLFVYRQGRPGEREPPVRQGPLRLRLCQQSAAPDAADGAQGRRRQARRRSGRSGQSVDAFPRRDLGRGDGARGLRPREDPRPRRAACARRLRLGEGLERGGVSVSEAGAHRLRLQQRRSLHAALSCLVGGGAARRRRLGGGDRDVQRVQELRRHRRHRRQPDREPSGRRDLLQAGGKARRQAHHHGSARHRDEAPRLADDAVQERHRRCDAQRACSTSSSRRSCTTSSTCRPTRRISTSSPRA